jgi:hypothetical protein
VIHVYASRPHYLRHIRPIFDALPDELRGQIIRRGTTDQLDQNDIVLVGGALEFGAVPQRMIYVEHGAGQTYLNLDPRVAGHYAGSEHPERVIGYICPNQEVADSWKRPAIAVGCPALDQLQRKPVSPRACAITFHWDARKVAPEARSARDHYAEHLGMIVQWIRTNDLEPLGHWHPNDRTTKIMWEHLGIRTESSLDAVLEQSTFMILDNSSAGYEANHMEIHTIWLNAPWYRKDVHHGLRFWDRIPGPTVDDAWELVSSRYLSTDYDPWRAGREEQVDKMVYSVQVGGAKLAAEWILQLLSLS